MIALPRWLSSYRRLVASFLMLQVVVLAGATAFFIIGAGRWTFFDCLYMTIITISTVGFSEVLPGMQEVEAARLVTLTLIVTGTGIVLYFLSSLTALIIEGDLRGLLKRRRTMTAIDALQDHFIVCGAGTTGRYIIKELHSGDAAFVAVDIDATCIQEVEEELGTEILSVVGDATEDHVLEQAGVHRARGVICALNDDKANLFVTITARALNADARIVAKSIEVTTEDKLRRAGANAVVSPNLIGGVRLASEMIRPHAVEFMDKLLRDHQGSPIGIEAVSVPAESALVGKHLAQAPFREAGALVIAVHHPDGQYTYNPGGEYALQAGSSLIVLADLPGVRKVRQLLSDSP